MSELLTVFQSVKANGSVLNPDIFDAEDSSDNHSDSDSETEEPVNRLSTKYCGVSE